MLDDGTGRAVGYIIGTPDTAAFAQRWRDAFAPIVDPKLVPRPDDPTDDARMQREDVRAMRAAVYGGHCSMLQNVPGALAQYPAHLHVDVLPDYQGRGWGNALMDAFLRCVKGMGAGGVHLGMVRGNDGARRFYERLGFAVCGEVLDGGVSGEVGREGEAICLVKAL